MSVEAMKQALDALALFASDESDEGQMAIAAHEALRQAIGQAGHIPDTTKMMPTGKDSLQVQAMKQALEALSNTDTHPISSAEQYFKETQAMEALQDAIDDVEEQKPVAWGMVKDGEIYDCITPAEHEREQGEYTVPLYAAPPTQPSAAYYLPNEGHAHVVWSDVEESDEDWNGWLKRDVYFEDGEPLMHSEPEWVGLTDEERYLNEARSEEEIEYARAIEAKLKEKNT